MTFQYEDGCRVETQPNRPYGVRARLFNPDGKLVKQMTFEPNEEEHWAAEVIYVRHWLMKNGSVYYG